MLRLHHDACWRSVARAWVCHDLRSKGLVAKDGISFGCDFVAYARDPTAVHGSCLVFVAPQQVCDCSTDASGTGLEQSCGVPSCVKRWLKGESVDHLGDVKEVSAPCGLMEPFKGCCRKECPKNKSSVDLPRPSCASVSSDYTGATRGVECVTEVSEERDTMARDGAVGVASAHRSTWASSLVGMQRIAASCRKVALVAFVDLESRTIDYLELQRLGV